METSASPVDDVLSQLDGGEISVDEAIRLLKENGDQTEKLVIPVEQVSQTELHRWDLWWILPITVGVCLTLFGGWLAWLGGWWWLLAAPLLTTGLLSITLGVMHDQLPWVHVRVDTGSQSWPQRIIISIPFPVGLGVWLLKAFGDWFPSMDRASAEQLAYVLENLDLKANPISVYVDEGHSAERVEVYIG